MNLATTGISRLKQITELQQRQDNDRQDMSYTDKCIIIHSDTRRAEQQTFREYTTHFPIRHYWSHHVLYSTRCRQWFLTPHYSDATNDQHDATVR